MSDTSRDEILRRQATAAQAMSKEELAKRQEAAAAGARNAWADLYPGNPSGLANAWGMAPSVVPPPPTRVQRFKQWIELAIGAARTKGLRK